MPKQVCSTPTKLCCLFTLLCTYRRDHVKHYVAILKPGDQLNGYKVTEVSSCTKVYGIAFTVSHTVFLSLKQTRTVPELQLTAIQLQHEKTGAKHLHVDRDDSNNVFAVGFSTPVSDSTGVPHILVRTSMKRVNCVHNNKTNGLYHFPLGTYNPVWKPKVPCSRSFFQNAQP